MGTNNRCLTRKVLVEVKAKGVEAYAVACNLSNLNAVDDMLKEITKAPIES